ncbi:sensor histidine kinase [Spirulina sp. 06S082]|uniref:sensor histidine kinase n=1 Tax=Spirulina sp. 06S082 TaxID=3110248 RepID=UPI002B210DFD|nr:response regulator [Spirulina sp. 06S082]MEA5467251.1 response regulator [Spirulina sp. 06S082]
MSNKGQILAVDDTPANLQVIGETLRNAGYTVATAIDGERALKRLQRYQPDLVLLDIQMPGIDGFETCRRLKAAPNTQHIPVIFITALSDTINKVKGLQIGGVDYITKPFDCAELLARIQVHINLKKAQLQLIQESKLSTLGELVAGIAHEVNNPINFIYGNLKHAAQYHQDMLHLLELYENQYPDPPQAITDWREQIDLAFLKKDYFALLESMKTGTERIKGIVVSLRSFSKLDESEWKTSDIHEDLNNTLTLLSYRLQANSYRERIKIDKNYGELPLIYCNPAQLNQVFMNLLVNALEAIDAKYWHEQDNVKDNLEPPQLIISTAIEMRNGEKFIGIHIQDNGVGIPEEIQPRIFEQFFTTKSTGKGTGLGLAIAHQIVTEKHGGAIACRSELGTGTEFIIFLPL